MAEEKRKARSVYKLMFPLLGVALLLILNSFLTTTIVFDKVDVAKNQVSSLFCTFERVEFSAEDVLSIVTGEKATIVNITMGNDFYQFYTYNASKMEFIDVGLIDWRNGQLLAFSSERLTDGVNYVIESGKIIYLYYWGESSPGTPIVRIEKIHEQNWFDNFVSQRRFEISVLVGFAFALTCSIFCLPFMEENINRMVEKRGKAVK